ncbi:uncharacterized protein LOC101864485 [Aplysia californica]|uniref:Uncharacterized protein LOC101864485 n=2 Tax=Aplysia californica TaxID=6500 RepID=A0ABM1AB91_APLCA|nr:uncharacterized protein LOC101864485 [Aplysia californica]
MGDDVTAIATNIVTAIDTERTDVICSVLSELGSKKYNHDPDLLQKVLNGLHTNCGTLLHYATKSGKVDKVRTLLAGGADPGIQNKDGLLPLDLASDAIRTVYNEELLKATAQSNIGRVCQLLAAGVDIHLTDSPEMLNTPLHWAVCHGNRDMVQCLCARGADLNIYNTRGLTPLHEAVKRGDAGIVEELLNYGANGDLQVTSGENVGQTAVDMAEGKESVMQVFRAPRELPEPISNMNHYFDSKANLVRFDSLTSTDSILGNGDETLSSPKLTVPKANGKVRFETSSPLPSLVTDEKLFLVWPAMQVVKQGGGNPFTINKALPVFVSPNHDAASAGDMAYLWNLRRPLLESLGLDISINLLTPLANLDSPHILCHLNPRLSPQPGFYRLTVTPKQIKILCGSLESLSYAVSTVLHLMTLYKEEESITVPSLLIEDWPDLAYRGVLLDVSQGRISLMDSLEEYLDTLSLLKINQVYLYTRFHSNLPPQWQCPHTRSEVLHLSEFCHKRYLQLVPVVEVGPKVLWEDLPKLYPVFQDFLACFPHAQFVSAGPRLSTFLLDSSEDNLSVGDVQRFLPIASNQTLQLCGYPLHDLGTSMLQQLPPGIVFKEYAVKADHDYSKYCAPLAQLGINYFVCPGTAAWNSLAGCPEAAVGNIFSAAMNNEGALGMVVCDWTGKGHLNHQLFSWPGIITAAGLGWNKNTQKDYLETSLPALLNQYVFRDVEGALGSVVMELGRAETYAIRRSRNQPGEDSSDLPEEHGSILYRFLTHPDAVPLEFLSTDALQHVTRHVRKCQTALPRVHCVCAMGEVLKSEAQLTTELMLLACKVGKALVLAGRKPNSQSGYDVVNFGISNLTVTTRTDLANRLLELMKQFREVWTQRANPDLGLSDSVQRLRSLFKVLLPNTDHSSLLNSEADH